MLVLQNDFTSVPVSLITLFHSRMQLGFNLWGWEWYTVGPRGAKTGIPSWNLGCCLLDPWVLCRARVVQSRINSAVGACTYLATRLCAGNDVGRCLYVPSSTFFCRFFSDALSFCLLRTPVPAPVHQFLLPSSLCITQMIGLALEL